MRDLERELDAAHRGREQVSASLADRDRSRRAAEQRAHAEEALRRDLARQLASTAHETERVRQALGDLAAAEDRIRILEQQLHDARRCSDEAERVAAAAVAARARAERGGHQVTPSDQHHRPREAVDDEGRRLDLEWVLRSRRAAGGPRVAAEPASAGEPLSAERPPAEPQSPTEASPASPAEPQSPTEASSASPAEPQSPAEASPASPAKPSSVASLPTVTPVPQPADRSGPDGELVGALRRELHTRAVAEAGLRARTVRAETRLAARVLVERRTTATLRQLGSELDGLRDALEAERVRRTAAEGRVAELTGELGGQRERSRDAYAAIGELRGALDRLRPPGAAEPSGAEPTAAELGGAEPPAAEPSGAEPPAAEPPAGGGDRPGVGGPPTSSEPVVGPGPVVPGRLSDALTRLRETTAPRDPVDEPDAGELVVLAGVSPGTRGSAISQVDAHDVGPPTVGPPTVGRPTVGRPTVERPFRRLARRDADTAGRLLLDLLPLQRAAYPHPVSYDLVLGPGRGCVRVTVGEGAPEVELHGAARSREQVDFQVVGAPAKLARLLIAGPLRRRLRLRVARVRGRRDGLAAIDALLGLPLELSGLRGAGMRAAPELLLALVAGMIEPAWTRGERFTLSHSDGDSAPIFLVVRDGRAPEVTRTPPEGRVATEIVCSAAALVDVLAGSPGVSPAPDVVRGDRGPLTSLRDWIQRAQSA